MAHTKIFIVDDHRLFVAGLRSLLRDQEIEVIGEAASGGEALGKLRGAKVDIVLLDLTLPDGSGIQFLPQIQAHCPDARVIVLTMHDDAALAKAALARGARGFVVKTAADMELITAIQSVARGRTFVNLDLAPDEAGEVLTSKPTNESSNKQDPLYLLSKRERDVFHLLALGHTNQEIADQFDLSVKTVETYRARISEKYGFRGRADLIRFAVDAGLLAPGSENASQ